MKKASKSHKEKVEEYNKYLASLSEHHDMPKVCFISLLQHYCSSLIFISRSDQVNIGSSLEKPAVFTSGCTYFIYYNNKLFEESVNAFKP